MRVGEKKTVKIPPEEAYGPHDPDLVAVISKDEVPEGMEIRIGQKIPLKSNRGDTMTATVVEITEDGYILDGNQQQAGEELTFEIELVSIMRTNSPRANGNSPGHFSGKTSRRYYILCFSRLSRFFQTWCCLI
jgi:peptidylprolyl isomerase